MNAPYGPARCPLDRHGKPAPYGLDGFGRAAGRPLSASDRRCVQACALAILFGSPLATALLCALGA